MDAASLQPTEPTLEFDRAPLAWRQKFAAFWSISWPAWVISMLVLGVVTSMFSVERLGQPELLGVLFLTQKGVFFLLQGLFIPRLFRKQYRDFRIYLLRDNGEDARTPSFPEVLPVWVWIFLPQFLATAALGILSLLTATPAFNSLDSVLQLLVVGPYAVDLALRRTYSGFRMETAAMRYV